MEESLNKKEAHPLVEGQDYYWEKGFMVLTKDYLLKRGYCCGYRCRNCPWKSIKLNQESLKNLK